MRLKRIKIYTIILVICVLVIMVLFLLTKREQGDPLSDYKESTKNTITRISTFISYGQEEVRVETHQKSMSWQISISNSENQNPVEISYKDKKLMENDVSEKVEKEEAEELFKKYNFFEFPETGNMKNVMVQKEKDRKVFLCQIDPAFIPKALKTLDVNLGEVTKCDYIAEIGNDNKIISHQIELLLKNGEICRITSNFNN